MFSKFPSVISPRTIFRIVPCLCGVLFFTQCAITLGVKRVEEELNREVVNRSHRVLLQDSGFRVQEELRGDGLWLRLTGSATRIDVRATEYRVRYRYRKSARYRNGDMRLRFHALFWTEEFSADHWGEYALGHLALSGMVMVVDLVTYPLRMLQLDRKVRERPDEEEERQSRARWSPGDFEGECGRRRLVFRNRRARLAVSDLLAPPGRWQGTILCVLRTDTNTEIARHAIHLDRLAAGSPRIREYIRANQGLILRRLSAAVDEAERHFASNRTRARPSLKEIQTEIRLRERIIDLTRYIQPRLRAEYRLKESGEDLLYLEPEEIPA